MHVATCLLPAAALLALSSCAAPVSSCPDGSGEGWRPLSLADFVNVNGRPDTWTEHDGVIRCSGQPLGGARTKTMLRNFELVADWKHHTHAGNSGIFLWCPESAFTNLLPGTLPRSGIEVQVLDLGYETDWLAAHGTHSDWFTSHGDLFPVGEAKMTAFTPQITYQENGAKFTVGTPTSSRSFPTKRITKPFGEWNHYYVRAVNGEIHLWLNGEEINGGRGCVPAEGYLALESEGALVEFRNLRIHELP
jgi:hypothetical protein